MNNSHFIYVFSDEDKIRLLSMGYTLIKADERQNVFIFDNRKNFEFSELGVSAVFSDTLTF